MSISFGDESTEDVKQFECTRSGYDVKEFITAKGKVKAFVEIHSNQLLS